MSSFILNDKVRVIGQDYYNDSYDIIIDIVEGKEPYMIEDGCTYKQNELTEYIPNLYNKTKEEILTDKPNFILVPNRLDPKYWIRKKRHNANNLELSKMIAKHLILHRIWHGLTQNKIAIDLSVSHQQIQKFESCRNDIFFVQVAKIFKERKWNIEILGSNPYEVLIEWLKRDYNINSIPNYTGKYPDKYYKILDAWKLLDLKAEKNYYKK